MLVSVHSIHPLGVTQRVTDDPAFVSVLKSFRINDKFGKNGLDSGGETAKDRPNWL